VRITATASVTMFLSLHAVALSQAAGGIEVDFIPTRRRLDLATGEADIALRMRQVADADGLVSRRLGAIGFALYESAACPSGTIIGPSDDPNLSRQAAYIAEFAKGRPVAARIGDMPIRYQAAKAGLGAAFLPCWLGDRDPDLVRIGEPPRELVEDVFLVMVERSRVRPAVARVADALVALFRQNQDALLGKRAA
jgi:DNA-binding transcriptional LysR family regulator